MTDLLKAVKNQDEQVIGYAILSSAIEVYPTANRGQYRDNRTANVLPINLESRLQTEHNITISKPKKTYIEAVSNWTTSGTPAELIFHIDGYYFKITGLTKNTLKSTLGEISDYTVYAAIKYATTNITSNNQTTKELKSFYESTGITESILDTPESETNINYFYGLLLTARQDIGESRIQLTNSDGNINPKQLLPYIASGDDVNNIVDNTTTNSTVILNSNTNIATGAYSTAEGYQTVASNTAAHTEGMAHTVDGTERKTTASGQGAHAEGRGTTASGHASHAEGTWTTASGNEAHAEGYQTTASGYRSHVEGYGTVANHADQHVFGEYNVADASTAASNARGTYVEIVGGGSSTLNPKNIRTLDWSGNERLYSTTDAGLGNKKGALCIGIDEGTQLRLDNNELIAVQWDSTANDGDGDYIGSLLHLNHNMLSTTPGDYSADTPVYVGGGGLLSRGTLRAENKQSVADASNFTGNTGTLQVKGGASITGTLYLGGDEYAKGIYLPKGRIYTADESNRTFIASYLIAKDSSQGGLILCADGTTIPTYSFGPTNYTDDAEISIGRTAKPWKDFYLNGKINFIKSDEAKAIVEYDTDSAALVFKIN